MEPQRITGAGRILSVRQNDLTARARAAAEVAALNTVAVDAEARFPSEAFAEIRKQRLLGIQVPQALGGESASIAEIADVCYILGQACSSTALIYAMHQIKMACVVRHTKGSAALERILGRIADEQLLMASSTTEGQAGGNVRSSEAAVQHEGEQVTLERKATVISYAVEADGIVTTARRATDAPGSDQVLLVLLKADYTLERLQVWDTLGMRGTHSEGFTLRARAAAAQIMPEPYDRIHAQTMVPFAHLLWGSVWAGIAAAATGRAQAFIRQRCAPRTASCRPGAAHFTQAVSTLRTLRGVLAANLRSYEADHVGRKSDLLSGISGHDHADQGAGIRTRGDHGVEFAARLRLVRVSQRHGIYHRPAAAGCAVRASHDQQRSNSHQSGDNVVDDAAADVDQWLNSPCPP